MRLNKSKCLALLAALTLLTGTALADDRQPAQQPQTSPAQAEAEASATLTLTPADTTAEKQENGVWLVSVDAQEPVLKMKWVCTVGAVSFRLQVLDAEYRRIAEADAYGMSGSIKLPKAAVGQQVMVQLWAYDMQGSNLTATEIRVQLKASSGSGGQQGVLPDQEGENPWGSGSFRPGGGFNWGSLMGNRGGGSGSTGVIPGVGIGSGHADGNGSLNAYNTVRIDPQSGAMTELTLDGHTLPVMTTNGAPFTVQVNEAAVTLTPTDAADGWQIDGHALTLLNRSGVETLTLTLGESAIDLPTDYEPQGIVYTNLRVEGCTPSDFVWTITEQGVTASVDGHTYTLRDDRLHIEEE